MHSRLGPQEPGLSPELGSWGHTKELTDLLARGQLFPSHVPQRVNMYSLKLLRLLIYNAD